MIDHATAESNMIRMARLREWIAVAEKTKMRAEQHLRELKQEYAAIDESVRAEFLRRHAADEPLPPGVSVRTVSKLEYDADAVLADAIAEGITSVINYPKPRLRINEFKKFLNGDVTLFDGVTYRDVPTVFISEAATLRATMQGMEAEKRNIDIDTGEVPG